MTPAHIQHALGRGSAYWQDPALAWAPGVAQPWALVLGLAFPVIDRVDIRVRREEGIFRGQDLTLGNTPGVLLQRRVRRDAVAPWFWVAHACILQETPNPEAALPFFLDLLADRFRRLEGRDPSRAIPQDQLAGALSGKVWALLSGRMQAAEIMGQKSTRS